MTYSFSDRDHRRYAYMNKLAIKHVEEGIVGFISFDGAYEADVLFPDWKGLKRTNTYGHRSTKVKILSQTYDEYIKQKEKKEMTQALYEITKEDGSKVFATKMAEKSKTLWVMEVKGTGEFVAVDTSRIEEVVPYTIKVKLVGNGNVCHYEAEENKFSVGDILVLKNGDIVVVVDLNTKQKMVAELKAQAKLVTVAL